MSYSSTAVPAADHVCGACVHMCACACACAPVCARVRVRARDAPVYVPEHDAAVGAAGQDAGAVRRPPARPPARAAATAGSCATACVPDVATASTAELRTSQAPSRGGGRGGRRAEGGPDPEQRAGRSWRWEPTGSALAVAASTDQHRTCAVAGGGPPRPAVSGGRSPANLRAVPRANMIGFEGWGPEDVLSLGKREPSEQVTTPRSPRK